MVYEFIDKLKTNMIKIKKYLSNIYMISLIFTILFFGLALLIKKITLFSIIYLLLIIFIIILKIYKRIRFYNNNNNIEIEENNNITFNEIYINSVNKRIIEKKLRIIHIYINNLEYFIFKFTEEQLLDKYNHIIHKIKELQLFISNQLNRNTISINNNINRNQLGDILLIFYFINKLELCKKLEFLIKGKTDSIELKIKLRKVNLNIINSQKIKNIYNIEKIDDCSICLLNEEENDIYILFECMHYFHRSCINKWLEIKIQCPLCNKNLI